MVEASIGTVGEDGRGVMVASLVSGSDSMAGDAGDGGCPSVHSPRRAVARKMITKNAGDRFILCQYRPFHLEQPFFGLQSLPAAIAV